MGYQPVQKKQGGGFFDDIGGVLGAIGGAAATIATGGAAAPVVLGAAGLGKTLGDTAQNVVAPKKAAPQIQAAPTMDDAMKRRLAGTSSFSNLLQY